VEGMKDGMALFPSKWKIGRQASCAPLCTGT